MLATVGQPSFTGQPLLGKSGSLGEDGDSGESGLLGESGDSGDSALVGDEAEAASGAAAEASEVAAAPVVCPGSGSVVVAPGLASRGCAGPVSALSAVVACGEAILAAARTARVALSGSIACSSSSSGSSRSQTAPSGGIVTEADAT